MLHAPDRALNTGILIVIGGPTYRVGPQRMNVTLARTLADIGYPVMRFDFRGTGDSDGEHETPRQGEAMRSDIKVALDAFLEQVPDLQHVVLWGLCRGATRILEYAQYDSRVDGVVLLNPRVDNEQMYAAAMLRQYYWQRLTSPAFYKRVFAGDLSFFGAFKRLFGTISTALSSSSNTSAAPADDDRGDKISATGVSADELIEESLRNFKGKTMMILSGGDLEATKFKEIINRSSELRRKQDDPDFVVRELPGANHTFATKEWRDQAITWTKDWVTSTWGGQV